MNKWKILYISDQKDPNELIHKLPWNARTKFDDTKCYLWSRTSCLSFSTATGAETIDNSSDFNYFKLIFDESMRIIKRAEEVVAAIQQISRYCYIVHYK